MDNNKATLSLSEEIRQCREGVVNNPFQGKDKRVLFVCSMGILRSATGARLYAYKYNTRCCGTLDDALIQLNMKLLAWAEELVFVNKQNYDGACAKFGDLSKNFEGTIKILNIPDSYPHMHPDLQRAFVEQYEPIS